MVRSQLGTLMAVVALLASCGGPQRRPDAPASREEGFGGTLLFGTGGAGERRVEVVDDETLARRASEAFDRGDFAEALRLYDLLLQLSDSPLVPSALYDAGLTLLRLGRTAEAVERFRQAAERLADPADVRDALFRQARGLERLERWPEAGQVFARLLEQPLAPVERVEAEARLGRALLRQGRRAEAEAHLTEALAVQQRTGELRAVRRYTDAALAAFTLGDLYRELFDSVKLVLPLSRMKRDLGEKATYLLQAQARYLRAMRFQHRVWSVAAGVRLGELYERMRADLLAAELPTELPTAGQRAAYLDHLDGQLVPLVDKALIAYERTLELSERMGTGREGWARRSAEGAERLRSLQRAQRGERGRTGRDVPPTPAPAARPAAPGSAGSG